MANILNTVLSNKGGDTIIVAGIHDNLYTVARQIGSARLYILRGRISRDYYYSTTPYDNDRFYVSHAFNIKLK